MDVALRRALALLLLTFPLVACAGSGIATPSLAQAATKSSKASTVKIDMRMTMSSPQLPEPLTSTFSGGMDNTHRRGDFTVDMSNLAAEGGSGNPADWKGEEIIDAAGGRLILYMRLPIFARLVPGGKPWLRFDVAALDKKLGVDLAQFTQLTGNPAQMLDWLRATSGKITTVGKERVGGEDTTHYHAIVDLSKYPDAVPPERRAAARRAVTTLIRLAHVRPYPVDAWVAGDGLIRKMSIHLTETIQGQRLSPAITLWFHDYGAPVTVTLPSAGETTDLSRLAGG